MLTCDLDYTPSTVFAFLIDRLENMFYILHEWRVMRHARENSTREAHYVGT